MDGCKMDTSEKKFEQDIEYYLLTEGGYVKGDMATASIRVCNAKVVSISIFNAPNKIANNMILKAHYKC